MLVAFGRRGPLLLLVVFVLAACGGPPPVPLTGQVRDAYTREPIEGALVTFGKKSGHATDAEGRYKTDDWSLRDTVVIQAAGYAPETITLAERPELQRTPAQSLTMDAELRPNTLRGEIRDAYTDQPIAGAVVRASSEISATTDEQGRYELEGVPETYQLTVEATQYAQAIVDGQRTTTQDAQLRPTSLQGMITDAYTNQPVPNVKVTLGDAQATSDASGRFSLQDIPPDGQLVFERQGYDRINMPLDRITTVDVVMRPSILEGVVRDLESSAPLSQTTVVASTTLTGTAISSARTDAQGRFRLENVPAHVFVTALLPGYKRAKLEVTGGKLPEDIKLEPLAAKALYIKTSNAANRDTVASYFDIIDRTETNAVVLDLKSDNLEDVGRIYYQSNVPLIRELETSAPLMDIEWILAEARRRDIYTIARIHVFAHDNALLEKKPDWYVQDTTTGKPWFADFGIAWLDAYNQEVWDYNIQLAVEAAQLGFDEIQFDYIRFPSDGDLTNAKFLGPRDWRNNPDEMYNTIGRFMERAHKAINDAGAFFSVDVFGYAAWEPQASIGQNLQVMGRHADFVCPMVYPSHFLPNELGLGNPSLHPYEIVAHSMQVVGDQLTGDAARTRARPWLQDFTLIWVPENQIVQYGANEVRAQIDAAEQNGASGWALWDSDNNYTVDALKAEE